MKRLFITLFTTTSLLFAGEHIQVGSRPMSEAALEQLTSETAPEGDVQISEEAGLFYSHSPSSHYLARLLPEGVELEDGSVWHVDDFYLSSIYWWRTLDPLTITQNRSWLSSYKYRIVNQNTGDSIPADLFLSPVLENGNTRLIAAIDTRHGEMALTDGSVWIVSPRDEAVFKDWILHDMISIGFNSGWDSSYDHILINSNMNNFVRVRQL